MLSHPNAVLTEGRMYTKFEKTRIIASRALQIAQGSPVFAKIPKGVTDPIHIAEIEWNESAIPIDIKRGQLGQIGTAK